MIKRYDNIFIIREKLFPAKQFSKPLPFTYIKEKDDFFVYAIAVKNKDIKKAIKMLLDELKSQFNFNLEFGENGERHKKLFTIVENWQENIEIENPKIWIGKTNSIQPTDKEILRYLIEIFSDSLPIIKIYTIIK